MAMRRQKLYYAIGSLETPIVPGSNNAIIPGGVPIVITKGPTVAPTVDRYGNYLAPNVGAPSHLTDYAITAHFVPSVMTSVAAANVSEGFFYAYNVAAHTAIALSAAFPFDTAGPTSGVGDFLFTASANPAVSGAITVVQAGTYQVEFSATVDEPRQISLWVGGIIVNPITQSTRYGGATGTTTTTGFAIITVTAGQVLSLRNDQSTGAITPSVAAGSGPSAIVVNSIMIKRLGVSGGAAAPNSQGIVTVTFQNAVTHAAVDDPATVPEVEVVLRVQGLSGGTIAGTLYIQKQHSIEA